MCPHKLVGQSIREAASCASRLLLVYAGECLDEHSLLSNGLLGWKDSDLYPVNYHLYRANRHVVLYFG